MDEFSISFHEMPEGEIVCAIQAYHRALPSILLFFLWRALWADSRGFFAITTATSEKTSFKYKVSSSRSYFEIIPTAAPCTI